MTSVGLDCTVGEGCPVELSVELEPDAKHFGERKDPVRMRQRQEHVLMEILTEEQRALRVA